MAGRMSDQRRRAMFARLRAMKGRAGGRIDRALTDFASDPGKNARESYETMAGLATVGSLAVAIPLMLSRRGNPTHLAKLRGAVHQAAIKRFPDLRKVQIRQNQLGSFESEYFMNNEMNRFTPARFFTKKDLPHISIDHKTSPQVFAHELGHAAIHRRKLLSSALGASRVGAALSVPVSLGAQSVIDRNTTMSDKKRKRLRFAAAALPAAVSAPTLWDEGMATVHGARFLKDAGFKSTRKRVLKTLVPAWSTYAISAAPAVATGAFAGAVYRRKDKLRREGKLK